MSRQKVLVSRRLHPQGRLPADRPHADPHDAVVAVEYHPACFPDRVDPIEVRDAA